jgi:signal transduction histidine kinase
VVLDNLLGNAWKYTGRKPQAAISLRLESATPTTVAIRDNGIGFEESEAGRLFQAFERLPSGQGFQGTGIGLATVRRVVERHGGRAWAEGRPGEGATFHFSLGQAPALAAAAS